MPSIEPIDEDIPISEQIRLAQASGLFAQPSAQRRSAAGQPRDAPLVSKIPSDIDGADLIEVDYTDVDGVDGPSNAARGQAATQPELDIWDEIFFASLYVIPLSSLYLLLDMCVLLAAALEVSLSRSLIAVWRTSSTIGIQNSTTTLLDYYKQFRVSRRGVQPSLA